MDYAPHPTVILHVDALWFLPTYSDNPTHIWLEPNYLTIRVVIITPLNPSAVGRPG